MATPGRWLRQARRRAGLTQRELSVRAHIPQATIARIEAGTVDPRVGTLATLLGACGERLEARVDLSVGIDRAHLEGMQEMTAGERVDYTVKSSANLADLLGHR